MNKRKNMMRMSSGRIFAAVIALCVLAWTQVQPAAHASLGMPETVNWEQQAPYPTRFAVNGVDMVSATEAWAVAYIDILHTTDGGTTWEKQQRPGNDNLYSVDFFDSQHGIAMGNTTLYTQNGGDTWSEVSTVFGYDVEMADANLAFITDHRVAGYFRSTNGGATWTFHTMATEITTINCFDSLNCVANSPAGTYHSTDSGLNWTFISGSGGTYASTFFVNHNMGWFIEGNTASHTTDGGATWSPQTLPPGSWIYDTVFADPNNGWSVGSNIIRTTNGGATWEEVPTPQEFLPLWDVSFADAQHGIAGGDSFLNTESVILTTGDGGATWASKTNGSINQVLDMMALDRDHAWAAHDYGGKISRTTDGGRTWMLTEVGEQYIQLNGIDMADTLNGWMVGFHNTYYDGHIYHTTDGGASWQRQYNFGADVLRAVAALDTQTAIILGGDNFSGPIRQRTTDGGATWHELNMPITSFLADVFFLNSETGWMVGGNGDIVKTTDGGDTWVVQNNPAQYTLSTIHFSDPNNGWAGGNYGTLVRTTNAGATWTLQNPQIPEYTHVLSVNSTSPMRGWISGYGGGAESRPFVKYTTDGGASWIDHTPQVGPYDSFSSLAFTDDEYGWAAGAGGIFLHNPGGPTPTPTATSPATQTPTRTNTPPPATATSTGTAVLPTSTQPQPTGTGVPPTSTSTLPAASETVQSSTETPVATATAPIACTVTFVDIPEGSTFYSAVHCLACRGIIAGYTDGTFRPGDNVTRGQVAKIVANAAGFTEPVSGQTFSDVPSGHTFYEFIERIASRGIITGYPDGTFRPGNGATRGQLSKIVSNTRSFTDPPTEQHFADVLPGSTFYDVVERLASRGVMNGYPCGGSGEPCDELNRPYFRTGVLVTRGQTAQIVSRGFFPECTAP